MLTLVLLACVAPPASSPPSSVSSEALSPPAHPIDGVDTPPVSARADLELRLNLERGYRELELGAALYRQGREVTESTRDRLRDLAQLAGEVGVAADAVARADAAARFGVGWTDFAATQGLARIDGKSLSGGALTRQLPNSLRLATVFSVMIPDLRSTTLGLPPDGFALDQPGAAVVARAALDDAADRLDVQTAALVAGEERLLTMYEQLFEANGRIDGACPTSVVLSAAHIRAVVGAHVAKRAAETGSIVDFGLVALERYAGVLADPDLDDAERSQVSASWTATVEVIRDAVEDTKFDREMLVGGQRPLWGARFPAAVEELGVVGMDVVLPNWTMGALGVEDLDPGTPEGAVEAADVLAGIRRDLALDRAALEESAGRLEGVTGRVEASCWR